VRRELTHDADDGSPVERRNGNAQKEETDGHLDRANRDKVNGLRDEVQFVRLGEVCRGDIPNVFPCAIVDFWDNDTLPYNALDTVRRDQIVDSFTVPGP
jgi:hypothetical protein